MHLQCPFGVQRSKPYEEAEGRASAKREFTDRFSYAITGSHPHFILSTPKNSSVDAQKQQIVTYDFPLNICLVLKV